MRQRNIKNVVDSKLLPRGGLVAEHLHIYHKMLDLDQLWSNMDLNLQTSGCQLSNLPMVRQAFAPFSCVQSAYSHSFHKYILSSVGRV